MRRESTTRRRGRASFTKNPHRPEPMGEIAAQSRQAADSSPDGAPASMEPTGKSGSGRT